jgi:hypothetical protein
MLCCHEIVANRIALSSKVRVAPMLVSPIFLEEDHDGLQSLPVWKFILVESRVDAEILSKIRTMTSVGGSIALVNRSVEAFVHPSIFHQISFCFVAPSHFPFK